MLLSGGMTDVTVQYSGDVFLMGKRDSVNLDVGVLKPLMTFAALRMGDFSGLGQRDGSFGMACRAGGLLSTMTFKAGLFRRSKCGRIVRVVVNIVVARGTGVFQLLDMELVWNPDTVGVDLRGGRFHIEYPLMTSNAVRIDLVKFGRKTCMFSSAFKGKDIDAGHQGMACRMTLRTVDLGMEGRLLPK